jgi:hypothetical protein
MTVDFAVLNSPAASAGRMLDHDTDSDYKISRAFLGKQPAGRLTRDRIVARITLYWPTGTGGLGGPVVPGEGRCAAVPPRKMEIPGGVPAAALTTPQVTESTSCTNHAHRERERPAGNRLGSPVLPRS